MRTRFVLATVLAACLASNAHADDFFVNGATGADNPGHGGAATPWKTISYALQQLPGNGTHTLYVVGPHRYSAASGETFPLTLVPGVALVGIDRPVILIPDQEHGIRLAPDVSYDYDEVRVEGFEIRGGARGIDMGAKPGYEHALRVNDCWFFAQSDAGIKIEPKLGATAISEHHLRLWRSCIEDGMHGVFVETTPQFEGSPNNGQSVEIEVPETLFRNLAGDGLRIEHTESVDYLKVRSHAISAHFERCRRGIAHIIETAEDNDGAFNEIATFARHCEFSNSDGFYSIVAHFPPTGVANPLPRFLVEKSIFSGNGTQTAIEVESVEGAYQVEAQQNTILNHANGIQLGVSLPHENVSPEVVATIEGIEVHDTGVGLALLGDPNSDWDITVERSRMLRTSTGVDISGLSGSSQVELTSNMLVAGTDGLVLDTGAHVVGHGLTIADNVGVGLTARGYGDGSRFASIMFDGNASDASVTGALPIEYSFFGSTAYPGVGNVDISNPELLRPSYKLSPNSPCIGKGDPTTAADIDYEGDARLLGSWDIGADEFQQNGSIQRFGVAGWGNYKLFPHISSPQSTASIGSSFDVTLERAIDSRRRVPSAAYLLVGTRDDRALELPGAPGSRVWIDVLGLIGPLGVQPDGTSSVPVAIPAVPEIIGLPVTFQWLLVVPTANFRGVVTTDGLRVTLGS